MPECPACGVFVEHGCETCPDCGAPIRQATASFQPVGAGGPVAVGTEAAEGPMLVVRKGPQPGERFFVDRSPISVGRDPQSDIFLNDMTVSRAHAVLELLGDTVSVRDAGSLNGTYVNGVCVDAAPLNSGDVLQIGTFQMVFFGGTDGGAR